MVGACLCQPDTARINLLKAVAFEQQLPNGLNLSGLRWNTNAPIKVLAVHGWLDNAHSFLPIAEHLPDNIDFIAIDLAGHGHSDHRSTDSWYFLVDFIRDIGLLVDALNWPQFSLLGHSLGGAISCLSAAAYPERIQRLAIVEGLGPLPGEPHQSATRLRDAVHGLNQVKHTQLRRHNSPQSAIKARLQSNRMKASSAALLIERGLQQVSDGWIWRTDPRLRIASPVRFTEAEILYALEDIHCPVLQVVPEPLSGLMPVRQMQRRKAMLKHYTEVQVNGHHHVHMDEPLACAKPIFSFLNNHLDSSP